MNRLVTTHSVTDGWMDRQKDRVNIDTHANSRSHSHTVVRSID